jgi:hypothetical protein
MTPIDPLERHLPDGLANLANPRVPSYLNDILADTGRARQRPAWSFLERWLPMALIERRPATAPPLRAAWVLLLAAILALTVAAGSLIAGARLITSMLPSDGLPAAAALPPTNCPAGTLKSGDIATIAGTGTRGMSGDDGPALAANLAFFDGGSAAVDPSGAFYFSQVGVLVRRVGLDGRITTIAGTPSTTQMGEPTGVASDTAGTLYVADQVGWIWKRGPDGTFVAVAGTGVNGVGPDEVPAVDSQINAYGLMVAPNGDLIMGNFMEAGVWRRVDASGIIHRFAGNGLAGSPLGDGGLATKAGFGLPIFASAADQQGNVYLSDNDQYRIRKVDSSGRISTFAGTGKAGISADGTLATEADIGDPRSLAVDPAGNVYYADDLFHVVRKIDTTGVLTTIAGTGKPGKSGDCGPALAAQLNRPIQLAIHGGLLYVADIANATLRVIVL